MKEVLSIFFTMPLVLVTRVFCIVVKKRKLVLLSEWESGVTFYYLARVMSWFFSIYAVYCLYNFHTKPSVKPVVIIFCIMLPSLCFFLFPKNRMLAWFDKWQEKRRIRQFQSCPHCHKSHVFYRKVLGIQKSYYYLLNQFDFLVFLGDYYNLEHLAKPFIDGGEERFSEILSKTYPILFVSEDDYVNHRGEIHELSGELYCLACDKKMTTEIIQRGMVIQNNLR